MYANSKTTVHTPRSLCKFGISVGDITPPVGIYHRMWGAARHDQSEGIHRPLHATAMVFQALSEPPSVNSIQAVVALDHCLFGAAEVAAILDAGSQTSSIPREAIVLSFSHTHAAGLLNLDRVELPGGHMLTEYHQRLAKTIGRLLNEAFASVEEVTIEYAMGRCNLAAHRDYFDESRNEFVCGFNPSGPTDDTVVVARVVNRRQDTIATYVNYACHPTTLAWENRLISPDFPGALREFVQHATNAPSVYLHGASGDLGPIDGFVGDPEVADRNGRQLGYAALATLESLPAPRTYFKYDGAVVSGATIGTWKHQPISEQQMAQAKNWSLSRDMVRLDYRDDLPTIKEIEQELNKLKQQQNSANDSEQASELRAMIERSQRMLGRMQSLPTGETFPYQPVIWRMGDAIWIMLPGEPYHLLQKSLRERFPKTPIIIATVANGWGPSYLPTAESYGKGIYQESIAVLKKGALEILIDQLKNKIADMIE